MKYRHALCLYPYLVDHSSGIGMFPPTGLEYIATALKGHVERITIIDLRHESTLHKMADLHKFIQNEQVDLICVSFCWKAKYKKTIDYIKQLPSDRMIVVGGREATENVEDLFKQCPNVQIVVRGEGEETIVEFADDKPWEQIQGLSFRKDSEIIHNANRPLQSVKTITPPDRSLRRCKYSPVLRGLKLMPIEFDTILSSRGCPYKCKFCTFNLNPLGQKRQYEARDPEAVVEEIASSPARIIQFADDNFFHIPERVERICDLLIERGIKKIYCANSRLEVSRHPQMLEKAYKAGFRVMLVGVESATDRILKQLDKGFNTDYIRKAFEVLRQFNFWYHAYFIYGNINETEAEMLAIPTFAHELGVQSIGLSQLHIDKFTPLRQTVESTPGYYITPNGHVYNKEFDKQKLLKIRNKIRNRFWYRPAQMIKIAKSLKTTELLRSRDLARLPLILPWLGIDYAAKHIQKACQRA